MAGWLGETWLSGAGYCEMQWARDNEKQTFAHHTAWGFRMHWYVQHFYHAPHFWIIVPNCQISMHYVMPTLRKVFSHLFCDNFVCAHHLDNPIHVINREEKKACSEFIFFHVFLHDFTFWEDILFWISILLSLLVTYSANHRLRIDMQCVCNFYPATAAGSPSPKQKIVWFVVITYFPSLAFWCNIVPGIQWDCLFVLSHPHLSFHIHKFIALHISKLKLQNITWRNHDKALCKVHNKSFPLHKKINMVK